MNTTETSRLQFHFHTPADAGGQLIRYAVGNCSIGALLVARSTRGICAIFLDDSAEALREKLQDAFRDSTIQLQREELRGELEQVSAFIDNADGSSTLEIDAEGSEFQHRVWKLLREIPAGCTVSYSEIAGRLGIPGAARAVASACAANKLAVLIPCHRVIRGDGSVSGYRWGVDRKRRLLMKESAQ